MPQPAATLRPQKVVYVLGTQRGGTSIVGRLLSTIEGFASAGELRLLWSALEAGLTCGCGRPHDECEVWSKVLAAVGSPDPREVRRLQELTVPRTHSWWHARRLLRRDGPFEPRTQQGQYARLAESLYRAFAEVTQAEVVVDVSKHPSDGALLPLLPGISPSFVHVVRDPRGCVFSVLRRSDRASGGNLHPLDAARTSASWTARHRASDAIRSGKGRGRSLLVRYEDLADDPESLLGAVCELVGVPARWTPLGSGNVAHFAPAHSPRRLQRRRPKGRDQVVPRTDQDLESRGVAITKDERWRKELGSIDRLVTTALTAPQLRRYGYPFLG